VAAIWRDNLAAMETWGDVVTAGPVVNRLHLYMCACVCMCVCVAGNWYLTWY